MKMQSGGDVRISSVNTVAGADRRGIVVRTSASRKMLMID
jgi:hypothetical protein